MTDALVERIAKVLRDTTCGNCGGRKCMGCVFREYDHLCDDTCPDCCDPGSRFTKEAMYGARAVVEALGLREERVFENLPYLRPHRRYVTDWEQVTE